MYALRLSQCLGLEFCDCFFGDSPSARQIRISARRPLPSIQSSLEARTQMEDGLMLSEIGWKCKTPVAAAIVHF
jgi:hypothetical protein